MSEYSVYTPEKYSTEEVSLRNALLNALPAGHQMLLTRHQDFTPAVTLGLTMGGLLVNVECGTDGFIGSLDALRDIDPAALPAEIRAAAAEIIFADELRALGALLDANVSAASPAENMTRHLVLDVIWRRDDSCLPLRVIFPDSHTALTFTDLLRAHPAPAAPCTLPLSTYLYFDKGSCRLTRRELLSLECGDVLVSENLAEGRLEACIGRSRLQFTLDQEGQARLEAVSALPANTEDPPMTDNTDTPAAASDGSGEGIDTGSIELTVRFELDRKLMSLTEISALRPGAVLKLSCDSDSPVTLRVGDTVAGQGRIVDVGGTVGVLITSLKDRI